MRNTEHDPVENVEGFGTEFKVFRFAEPSVETSEYRQVEIAVGVRNIRVHFLVSVRVRWLHREGIHVKPLRRGMEAAPLVRIAGHVDSLLKAAANVFGVAAVSDGVGQSGTKLADAVEGPTSGQVGYQLVLGFGEGGL